MKINTREIPPDPHYSRHDRRSKKPHRSQNANHKWGEQVQYLHQVIETQSHEIQRLKEQLIAVNTEVRLLKEIVFNKYTVNNYQVPPQPGFAPRHY